MRKPKTPLMSFLRKSMQKALIAESHGDDFVEKLEEEGSKQQGNAECYDRRQFIVRSVGSVAAGGLFLSLVPEASAAVLPRIAIVGGGIAGLNGAYQLRKLKGFRSNVTVYEGSSANSWGRIRTKSFEGGITADIGGEFIDTDHADMHALAREFGLFLSNNQVQTKGLIGDSYFFGGRHYTEAEVIRQFKNVARIIGRDNKNYESENPQKVAALDNISIEQYLSKNLKLSGWFYDLLNAAYTSEFGSEIGEQSALNFITMIGIDTSGGFKIFGDSDELFKISGGGERLIDALKGRLAGQIETDKRLEAIRKNQSDKYTLSFSNGNDVDADIVVMALPFTQLRKVDIGTGIFTPEKMKAIRELGYGSSSKLLLSTRSRIWREQIRSGYLFNETVQNGWDNSLGQKENKGRGGYTVFLGGDAGRSLDRNDADRYVRALDAAFPGFSRIQESSLAINWSREELVQGGYACYKVGQWSSISGEEITPQQKNTVFFCGEHCSSDYQGYMNGGAETGRDAAARIIKKLTPARSPRKKVVRRK